jgi:hypothetical protein
MFITARATCSMINAQAPVCQPQMIHSTLLPMNHQNPRLRSVLREEATNQAATILTAMAGHCTRSRTGNSTRPMKRAYRLRMYSTTWRASS